MTSELAKTNGGALAVSGSVRIEGIAEVFRLAEALSQASGLVPAAYLGKPNAIAAAMLTGIEIGLGPMESLREIHVVQGRPTLSAGCMLARAIRAGIKVEWLESSNTAAKLRLTRGAVHYEQSWTMEDAKRADLANKSGPWKTYPAAMLRARAISAAVRAFCPDVIGGGGLYTPEELEGVADETPTPRRAEVSFYEEPRDEPSETRALPPPRLKLSEVNDRDGLFLWCAQNQAALSKTTNGEREDRQRKVADAALRCGVDDTEALSWCGLVDEAAE